MRYLILLILFIPLGLFAQKSDSFFFVFLNSNPDKEVLDSARIYELQNLHLANIDRSYSEGKIVAAGPFYDGGGLFVFRESSINAVNDLLKTDPAIAANRFLLEVYPMEFVSGDIGQYLEPIEMVSYSFIRIQKDKNKSVLNKLKEMQTVYGPDVLSSVIFNNHSGGFILLETNHELLEEKFNNREKSQNPTIILKRLYIAKGTFQRDTKI